jgi:LCP family protein required for cell wall assembly
MNELDVLERWHPAHRLEVSDPHDAVDHEAQARRALDDLMTETPATRPRARRRLAGRALVAVAVTTALVTGGVLIARRTFDEAADRVHRIRVGSGTLDRPAAGAPTTILVVGSDSRAFVHDAAQAQAFGTPAEESGQRSDTMILVRVDGDRATGVWLPRDLVVPDGAGGHVQLNSFLNRGPAAEIAAVRDLTGEPVDHYVQVDFAAFIRVVDALGGVRMYVPAPMRDVYSGLSVATPGCTTFDGDEALAWARSRHAEYQVDGRWSDASPRADLDRIGRQQALLQAIGTQTRARVGGDPSAARDVASRVFSSLTVDAGMDRDMVESLAGLLARPARITMVTAPNEADAEPGRLHLLARAPGDDFFTWALGTTPAATPAPDAPTRDGAPPAAGASC